MTCRDARAAHGDRAVVGDAGLRLCKTRSQILRRRESSIRAQIQRERMIDRPGYMARNRIDRFDCAGITFRCPCVEEPPIAALHSIGNFGGIEPGVALLPCFEAGRRASWNLLAHRQAGCDPCFESAVEHLYGDRKSVV